ncbi:MAG: hypothetical protein FRX49_04374 [Trebouxia sp. A1-2]|nr:MAG: hypothetical protein FRX49_04374 [Trebouxia sp. A1-2]
MQKLHSSIVPSAPHNRTPWVRTSRGRIQSFYRQGVWKPLIKAKSIVYVPVIESLWESLSSSQAPQCKWISIDHNSLGHDLFSTGQADPPSSVVLDEDLGALEVEAVQVCRHWLLTQVNEGSTNSVFGFMHLNLQLNWSVPWVTVLQSGFSARLNTLTLRPCRASKVAATRPLWPAPNTITSGLLLVEKAARQIESLFRVK